MTPPIHDVVIIGGGTAGLSAALNLSERGLKPVLLEADPHSFGGRAGSFPELSFDYRGKKFTFAPERGVHAWWPHYRNLYSLAGRLGADKEFSEACDQSVNYSENGKTFNISFGKAHGKSLLPAPFHHAAFLKHSAARDVMNLRNFSGLLNLAKKIVEAVKLDPENPLDKEYYTGLNVADYTEGLPRFWAAFMKGLCRAAFFSEPEEVSLFSFLAALQRYALFEKKSHCFSFPEGPLSKNLFEPLLEKIRKNGGTAFSGIHVDKVERGRENGWIIYWHNRNKKSAYTDSGFQKSEGMTRASNLILALDAENTSKLIAASPALGSVYKEKDRIRGKASAVARIFWAKSPPENSKEAVGLTGGSFADLCFWLHRFQTEFKDNWHGKTGGGVSESHIYDQGKLKDLKSAGILDKVQKEVEDNWPGLKGSMVFRILLKNQSSHYGFPTGHNRPAVKTIFPDLFLCGDWIDGGASLFCMENACCTGFLAANGVLNASQKKTFPIHKAATAPYHVKFLQEFLRAASQIFPGILSTKKIGRPLPESE